MGYDGTDEMAVTFEQRGGEGVERAGGRLRFMDDLLDLLLRCVRKVR